MDEADDADADAATSRCLGLDGVKMAASAISTSSPSPSDEDDVTEAKCALLTGMTRVAAAAAMDEEAEEEEEARRGRFFFDGVSGSKMPSSSSDADTMSEREKATLTLRFALLLMLKREEEGVKFALLTSRIADLVGEAEAENRECDGVVLFVGVFDVDADADADADAVPEASALAFFLRISLTVARMDSFNSTHSSSIIFKRRSESLTETLYLLTNDKYCTLESWAGKVVEKMSCTTFRKVYAP
jgi:hypothetical protein